MGNGPDKSLLVQGLHFFFDTFGFNELFDDVTRGMIDSRDLLVIGVCVCGRELDTMAPT